MINPQNPLNRNRTSRLSEHRINKVKPIFSAKKGFLELVGVIALVIVVIGVAYFGFITKPAEAQVTGTPLCTKEVTTGCAQPPSSISEPVLPSVDCPKGYLLDNSGNCILPPCPTGQARDNTGTCIQIDPNVNPGMNPLPQDEECVPTGYFKSAYAWHKGRPGLEWIVGTSPSGLPEPSSQPVVSYQFVVTNECTANIYLEAGLSESKLFPLTILVSTPSACDGNPHYAGRFVTGNRNTKFTSTQPTGIIDVTFYPQDYNKEKDLSIVGGVYSGCLNDGGITIAEFPPQKLTIDDSYSDTEITNSVTKII